MKKLKLFLSLCMVCFCISFLYFGVYGVYASLNVTYSITGTITYTAPLLELKDSGTYWYTELGTLSDKTTPIRWSVVSLKGTDKYDYDSTKEPEIGTGTVFLQETCFGGGFVFDADEDTATSNYYTSDIRESINELENGTLTMWNITETEISTLIAKRNITSITYEYYPTRTISGTTSDYFWLLSIEEVETYLGTDDSDRIWKPDNYGGSAGYYWLRTPTSIYDCGVSCINDYGETKVCMAYYRARYSVRVAFQLA